MQGCMLKETVIIGPPFQTGNGVTAFYSGHTHRRTHTFLRRPIEITGSGTQLRQISLWHFLVTLMFQGLLLVCSFIIRQRLFGGAFPWLWPDLSRSTTPAQLVNIS